MKYNTMTRFRSLRRVIGTFAFSAVVSIGGVTTVYAQSDGYFDRDRDRDSSDYRDRDYDRRYDDRGSYDNDRSDYRDRREDKRDIEREKQRLEEERYALQAERARIAAEQQANAAAAAAAARPVARAAEQCPPGFQPSENKCSDAERKKGCKDMRLPGGLGCVHR